MVLLVEDEPLVRELVENQLKRGGYDVVTAASGEEALELVPTLAGGIDLLVTDVSLPGIDGEQLAERLKSTVPGLRVIEMSGNPVDAAGRPAGTAILQKPFSRNDLLAAIRSVLGDRA